MESNINSINRLTGTGTNRSLYEPISEVTIRKRRELEDLAADALTRVIENASFDVNSEDALQRRTVLEKINESLNSILEESKRNLSFGDKQKAANYVMDGNFWTWSYYEASS